KEIEASDSDWDREKLQERLAKLAGGVSVLRVGAATEVERKEKKHRLEDAISATRAAIEEGIIAGGGASLVHAAAALDDLGLSGDEATGVSIVRNALVEPARWIAVNAGAEGYVVTYKTAELEIGHGFNAATGEYGDLMAQGIIDPVKVTRSAVQNAASIAGMLLTTEALVVDKPVEEDAAEAGHGHGHGHWSLRDPRRRALSGVPRVPSRVTHALPGISVECDHSVAGVRDVQVSGAGHDSRRDGSTRRRGDAGQRGGGRRGTASADLARGPGRPRSE